VSATEKFKKLKDGSFNTHIYYGCTKAKDKYCKCGYISETDLIKQFQKIIDKIHLGKDVPVNNRMELVRVSKENLSQWALQLNNWGFADVPEEYLPKE